MNRITLILIVVSVYVQNIYCQNSSIFGKVVYETSLTTLDSIRIELLDSMALKTVYSDDHGQFIFENLQSGNYSLLVPNADHRAYKIINILVGKNDTIEIDFNIKDPCQIQHQTNSCPFCNSSKEVLRIAPGTIVSYNFGNNRSAIRRYNRKILKNGYETYVNLEGEEVVISILIEGEKEKFWDGCHHWFCKKCKKVF